MSLEMHPDVGDEPGADSSAEPREPDADGDAATDEADQPHAPDADTGADQPDAVADDTDEPDPAAETDADQPDPAADEADQPDPTADETDQPDAAADEADQPDTDTDTDQPDPAADEADQPDPAADEADQPHADTDTYGLDRHPLTVAAATAARPADGAIDVTLGRRATVWSGRQLRSVLWPGLSVLVVLGLVGFAVGARGGAQQIVRSEFVYTLDESVPDSFLREDRRLLTQVVTLQSDAVLTPVADSFDLSVADLRDKIEIETVDLSELLRLEVRDADGARALAISRAVVDQYLTVSSTPLPSEDSEALRAKRDALVTELATNDAELFALQRARRDDAQLATEEESLERQIDLNTEQVNRIQGLLADALVTPIPASRQSSLESELAGVTAELDRLETELADVRTQRAELATSSAAESALEREIERLEIELATIDAELADRELGPLVASPVRLLSEPTTITRPAYVSGFQGMAVGVLLGLPVAGLLAYGQRKRQLWFG